MPTADPRTPDEPAADPPAPAAPLPAVLTPDVMIIGAGPAGLTAATQLSPRYDVLVVEREATAGGIPRHSDHAGYGLRDLHRFLSGPAYARRLVTLATDAGATIRTAAMVTGWTAAGAAQVTTPQGRLEIRARASVLATGARERPRSARLIPGDRPAGVYTTGQLQNLVHLHHGVPGTRAVIVGAELVSWSAALTLRHAGCRTVAMITEHRRPESYAAFNLAGRAALRVPVATATRVVRLIGRGRLTGVEVQDDAGARRVIDCDTVVFTGDWIPDNELARAAGIALDPQTKGPLVDTALRTGRAAVFAAGNVIHPVDTADIAALDGRHVAAQVTAWLESAGARGALSSDSLDAAPHEVDDRWTPQSAVRLHVEAPLRWITPGLVRGGGPAPPRGRLLSWTDELVRAPHVAVAQNGTEIAHRRLPWPASPGRAFRLPWTLLERVDFAAGDVTIGLR